MRLGGKNEKNAFSGLLFRFSVLQYNAYLPVAQLDSASDSDSEGRRFESCRVGQKNQTPPCGASAFFGLPVANLSRQRCRFACRPARGGITSGASYPVGAIKAHAKGAYKTPTRVSFSMQNRGKLPFSWQFTLFVVSSLIAVGICSSLA